MKLNIKLYHVNKPDKIQYYVDPSVSWFELPFNSYMAHCHVP
jgi:hypothetical protein